MSKLSEVDCKKLFIYLDGSHGKSDLNPAIDVRVHNTKNVLELLGEYQRLQVRKDKY